MQNGLTQGELTRALQALQAAVEQRDPAGIQALLRLTVSYSLYAAFDALRCEDRPFDRAAFAARVRSVQRLVEQSPAIAAQPARTPQWTAEAFVAELYSRCWAHYDDAAFVETIGLFEERFRLNEVEPGFLRGAECLDAGCGSGRFTLAMAKLGARRSVGIDLSERAVREAAERSRRLGGGDTVTFCQGSVLDMPTAWAGRFDFVCSSGVLHHTLSPVKGLEEIFRVLRPGGRAYVFVYGSGGLFWALVDVIRALVEPVPLELADAWLQSLGVPPGKLFNCLDHWYTPIQERVTQQEFESRVRRCGFTGLRFMPRAKVYDASERRVRFPEERDLVGEGDMRYLVEKPA